MKEINGMTFEELFNDRGSHIGCYGGCMCDKCTLNFTTGTLSQRVEHTGGCFAVNLQKMIKEYYK